MAYCGRRKIYTDQEFITDSNVLEVLQKAYDIHILNRAEINYLYGYYRGEQPILSREKQVRPEIKNMVVENRANEIVSFKVGYLMGEPIQYVSRGDESNITGDINRLNEYMLAEDKAVKDKCLADWFHICGTSYRMVLPDAAAGVDPDEAPFEIFTLDPRDTFVVYHNGLREKPVMGVKYVTKDDGSEIFSVYTENHYYEILRPDIILKSEPQVLGIPIIEYPANQARLGAFEVVLPILDAINTVDSNRMDGVEQFVQALMLFHNVDLSESQFEDLRKLGALKFKDIDPQYKADVKYITAELNQNQTQTLVDHMYETILTICGMPNRNGGSSTSDTGSAVIMRDGWSAAEARAKDSELMFKMAEKEFLKKVLRICRTFSEIDLKLANVEIRFTRRNYENIVEKANVLVQMLNNDKVAPKLAFQHCGLFVDPEIAYTMSMEYAKEHERENNAVTGNDIGDREDTE